MRRIKITTIILAIIVVTLVAFAGVYIKTQNRMENKVKDYKLGRELEGGRVVELKVVTEESVEESTENNTTTNTDNLTVENYEIVKKTIEERLKNIGAQDYVISLNEEDGRIRVELAEDDLTDTYVYFLTADGKVQITEHDTEIELLSDSMFKNATYTYTTNADGQYLVYMELKLTEEGQAKIEELQNEYAFLADEIEEIEAAQESEEEETTTEETSTEDAVSDETTTENAKKIAALTIAGSEYAIEKIEKNKIRVNIGSATTNTTYINSYINAAAELSMLINSGKYPVEYEIEDNRFVYSDITKEQLIYFAIAMTIVLVIVFVVFTIGYKGKGFLASISFIGFVSMLSLILRYTNVSISIEGIGAILLTIIINIVINQLILRDGKNIDYKKVILNLAPVIIITLVFCFAGWSNLSSFGMIMFWGLILIAVYNMTVTKTLLKLKESK